MPQSNQEQTSIPWGEFEEVLQQGSVKPIAHWISSLRKKDLSEDHKNEFYRLSCQAIASKYISKRQWLSIVKHVLKKNHKTPFVWLFFTSMPNAIEVFEKDKPKTQNQTAATDENSNKNVLAIKNTLKLLAWSVSYNDETRFNNWWDVLSENEKNMFMDYPALPPQNKKDPLLPLWLMTKLPQLPHNLLHSCTESFLQTKKTSDSLCQLFVGLPTLTIDTSHLTDAVTISYNQLVGIIESFPTPEKQLNALNKLKPSLRAKLFKENSDIRARYEQMKLSRVVNKTLKPFEQKTTKRRM